jgi:AraC-like DNA-binding protein
MHSPDARGLGSLPSANGAIARLAYAQLKEASVEPEPLLREAGLTHHQIGDPDARLRVRDQIRFLNLAASALHDNLLGFHLAQPIDLRELGLFYYALASSEVLSEALQRGARYSSIVNESIFLRYVEGAEVRVTFEYVGVSRHLDRHQIEFCMVTLVRMCRQLAGFRVVPTRVRFTHRRENADSECFEFFGGDLEFGAATDEVAFAKSIGQMPIVSADPYLNKVLIAYCEEALSRRRKHSGAFRSSVENAIVPLLPHGKARAGEIARRLGMSQRTFARRLALEGLTFSEILQALRSDLAERYLADKDLSVSRIAWLLGFQEVSAFTHAFKRWSGKAPRESRLRNAN